MAKESYCTKPIKTVPLDRNLLSKHLTSKEKGYIGEACFFTAPAIQGYIRWENVPTDKYGGDIDLLIFTPRRLLFIEIKDTNEDFKIYSTWLTTHIIDRWIKGYPLAKHFADIFGLELTFCLVITRFTPAPKWKVAVEEAVRRLDIHIFETGRQALEEADIPHWYDTADRLVKTLVAMPGVKPREVPIDSTIWDDWMVENSYEDLMMTREAPMEPAFWAFSAFSAGGGYRSLDLCCVRGKLNFSFLILPKRLLNL